MCPKTLTNTRKQLKQKRYKSAILLRCSQPLSTNQTPHPTTKMERQHRPRSQRTKDNTRCCLRTQQCARQFRCPLDKARKAIRCCAPSPHPLQMRTPHGSHPHQLRMFSWCSLERRSSSGAFRYGYLVTPSSQSPVPPSTAPPTRVRPLASGVTDFHDVTGGV